jgi:hypothetical protein
VSINSEEVQYRVVERYWRKMLSSRSWAGRLTWDAFNQIKERTPLLRPKGSAVKQLLKSVVREIRTLRSVRTGGG